MAWESRMVLLPTRLSTASIFPASVIRFERSGTSTCARMAVSSSSIGNRSRLRVVTMTFAPALTAMLSAAWPKDEVAPPDDQRLTRGELQVAEQARPGRGVVSGIAARSAHERPVSMAVMFVTGARVYSA
jgi:hypothetical protein